MIIVWFETQHSMLKILILQKLHQININRWIIYKKNEIKNVHFAGFLSMYLAKNLNTAPLTFALASQFL